jgi:hypothetical protein
LKGRLPVKKLLSVLIIGGVFGLGCSPSTPSGKTTKTPSSTTKEEKMSTGAHKEETKMEEKKK